MSTEILNKTAVAAAQQNAMERSLKLLPHGCRLFTVEKGWESQMVRGDTGVHVCDSLLALEKAVQDEVVKVIFIPLDAMMTDADIEKVCQRNGVTKTLFREVGKS